MQQLIISFHHIMARHNIFGKLGEDAAAEYLIKKGYIIRERNWRLGHLEVDIVAERDNCIVIVEVKTSSFNILAAVTAVDARKRAQLLRAANAYIKHFCLPHGVRIDVICVVGDNPDNFTIEHIEDAVRPRVRGGRCKRY